MISLKHHKQKKPWHSSSESISSMVWLAISLVVPPAASRPPVGLMDIWWIHPGRLAAILPGSPTCRGSKKGQLHYAAHDTCEVWRNVSKSGVRRNISKSSARRNILWPCVRCTVRVQLCSKESVSCAEWTKVWEEHYWHYWHYTQRI